MAIINDTRFNDQIQDDTWDIQGRSTVSSSTGSFVQRVRNYPPSWTFQAVIGPYSGRNFHEQFTFLRRLRDAGDSLSIGPQFPAFPSALGPSFNDSALYITAVNANNNSFAVTGLQVGDNLAEGDYLSIELADSERSLHQVTAAYIQGTTAEIPVYPGVPVAAGTALAAYAADPTEFRPRIKLVYPMANMRILTVQTQLSEPATNTGIITITGIAT